MGQIHGENTDFTGGKQVRMPVNREKFHHPRYKEIWDGYDDFRTYIVVGLLRSTTNFVHLGIWRRITLEVSRVVSRISHNNKNTTVSSTLFIPYLR